MVYVVGLTGSIGMGKSAVAQMFRDNGVPVWDADAAVHELYARDGKAVPLVGREFPDAIVDGAIDRDILGRTVLNDDKKIKNLEGIVHPLVGEHRQGFFADCAANGHDLAVVDVPLLFETGGEARVDSVVVVSARAEQQRERVLARPGMTEDRFESILARQVPDSEKRTRADHIVDTGTSLEATGKAVAALVVSLRMQAQSKSD